MPIESATYLSQLNTANPLGSDNRSTVDDHLRLIKATLRNTFTDINGEVSASATELNALRNLTATLQTQINNKLHISGTAVDALQWEGSTKYVSTATASGGSNGDFWFQWE